MKKLFIICVLFFSSQAFSYQFTGFKWSINKGQTVPYYISNGLSINVTDKLAHDAVFAGYEVWEKVNCSFIKFSYSGRITKPAETSSISVNDRKNVVSWRHKTWPTSSQALAVTSTMGFQRGGGIIDADMVFNGVHHSWATDGTRNKQDIQAVTAHEAGHFIGLGHVNTWGATMYPATRPGDTAPRQLHSDDMNGACALYPNGSSGGTTAGGTTAGGTTTGGTTGSATGGGSTDPFDKVGNTCSGKQGECGNGFCITDPRVNQNYCTNFCQNKTCPKGFTCFGTQNGGSACAKDLGGTGGTTGSGGTGSATGGSTTGGGATPGDVGQSCDNGCKSGLICVKTQSGKSYCTGRCQTNNECQKGFQCFQLQGSGGGACAQVPGTNTAGGGTSVGGTGGTPNPGTAGGTGSAGSTGNNPGNTGNQATSGQGGSGLNNGNNQGQAGNGGGNSAEVGGCSLNYSPLASSFGFGLFFIFLALLMRRRTQ